MRDSQFSLYSNYESLAVALLSTNLMHTDKVNVIVIAVLVCATASKFTPGAILVWVVTIESYVLSGVLGCYIQGVCYFQGSVIIQRLR